MKNVMLIGALLASSFTFGQDIDWSTISEDKITETVLQQENQMSAWVDYTNFVNKGGSAKKVKRTYKPFTEFEYYTLEMNSTTTIGTDVHSLKIYRSKIKFSQGYRYVAVSSINGIEDRERRTVTYQQF